MPTEITAPTTESIEAQLGARYQLFDQMIAAHPDLRPEWKYYGEKYGWTLKLFEKKRNLCFIAAREGELRVGFIFGDKQYGDALKSKVPASVKEQLSQARKFAEGRGVSLVISKAADLKTFEELLRVKRGPTKS